MVYSLNRIPYSSENEQTTATSNNVDKSNTHNVESKKLATKECGTIKSKLIYGKINQKSGYLKGQVMTGKKHKRGFWDFGNILSLDQSRSYTVVFTL